MDNEHPPPQITYLSTQFCFYGRKPNFFLLNFSTWKKRVNALGSRKPKGMWVKSSELILRICYILKTIKSNHTRLLPFPLERVTVEVNPVWYLLSVSFESWEWKRKRTVVLVMFLGILECTSFSNKTFFFSQRCIHPLHWNGLCSLKNKKMKKTPWNRILHSTHHDGSWCVAEDYSYRSIPPTTSPLVKVLSYNRTRFQFFAL